MIALGGWLRDHLAEPLPNEGRNGRPSLYAGLHSVPSKTHLQPEVPSLRRTPEPCR